MKQILLSLKTGKTEVVDVPSPGVSLGNMLIHSSYSLVSSGTEGMLLDFGKANLIDKARQQPDKIRTVLDKIGTDGLMPTFESVRNKLGQPMALGYCNVGVVAEIGPGVTGFAVGDRVASNGKHAEVVRVPVNLCAKVPDAVPDEQAAFTVLGAVALQGIRLAQPSLGEAVVVTGLGLIGQLTVQLLRAQGCRVLGIDFDADRLALARKFGAETVDLTAGEDPVATAQAFSRGRGVDAVLVTAATESSEPMHQAALMCRQRGRIVLVGVAGLNLSRDDFFRKELTFQVSCSYGPGRYDANYEEKGQDYPLGFVRWTEQRNLEAVLDMMSTGRLDVAPLISHRFLVEDAEHAYALATGKGRSLGILLRYSETAAPVGARTIRLSAASTMSQTTGAAEKNAVTVSFVGSGNFATAVLIPAFKAAGAHLRTVASSTGVTGLYAGRKFGFANTTTDSDGVFSDPASDTVVITTRHDSHARLVTQGLYAGKNVFVEKPLCLSTAELNRIEELHARLTAEARAPLVMVGFNRRFAPHVQKIKSLLAAVAGPKSFVMTVNAGSIPADHWTQNLEVGGGRIIGEACHFIDLLRFLAGRSITRYQLTRMEAATADTVSIQLSFADGSIGTVHYFANGSKRFAKERLEVFAGGGVLQLDNYRRLTGFGWPGFKSMNLWRQDKGHGACAAAFVRSVEQGAHAPIPFDEILEVSRVTLALANR